jgi:hypothetical protein
MSIITIEAVRELAAELHLGSITSYDEETGEVWFWREQGAPGEGFSYPTNVRDLFPECFPDHPHHRCGRGDTCGHCGDSRVPS